MAGHVPHAVLVVSPFFFAWGRAFYIQLVKSSFGQRGHFTCQSLAKQAHSTCQSLAKQAHFTCQSLAKQAHFTYEVFSFVPINEKPCKETLKQTFKIVFKRDFPYKVPIRKV